MQRDKVAWTPRTRVEKINRSKGRLRPLVDSTLGCVLQQDVVIFSQPNYTWKLLLCHVIVF